MLDPDKVSNNSPPPSPPQNEKWERDPTILHLDDQNFKDQLKKHKIVLVMFYAPWCGHCKKMKPDYLTAARELQSEGFPKCLAMVDCTANPEVTEEYQISGFPTIKLFKNGKFIADYTGKRTVEDIKRFALNHLSDKKDEL